MVRMGSSRCCCATAPQANIGKRQVAPTAIRLSLPRHCSDPSLFDHGIPRSDEESKAAVRDMVLAAITAHAGWPGACESGRVQRFGAAGTIRRAVAGGRGARRVPAVRFPGTGPRRRGCNHSQSEARARRLIHKRLPSGSLPHRPAGRLADLHPAEPPPRRVKRGASRGDQRGGGPALDQRHGAGGPHPARGPHTRDRVVVEHEHARSSDLCGRWPWWVQQGRATRRAGSSRASPASPRAARGWHPRARRRAWSIPAGG